MFDYINDPNVAIIYFLSTSGNYTCNEWGEQGSSNFPIIVDPRSYGVQDWYFDLSNSQNNQTLDGASPRHVFLDRDFNFRYFDFIDFLDF